MTAHVIQTFNEVLKDELGSKCFDILESLRLLSAKLEQADEKKWNQIFITLKQSRPAWQLEMAHSFAVLLEIINTCETAYRSHRLKASATEQKSLTKQRSTLGLQSKLERISLVMTAHPTEARTPQSLGLFRTLQALLQSHLDQNPTQNFEAFKDEIKSVLRLIFLTRLSKAKAPEVSDEADHVLGIVLRPDILKELLNLHRKQIPVFFRTWVGGDKDGHPGVDEKQLFDSLKRSRLLIVKTFKQRLLELETLIQMRKDEGFTSAGSKEKSFYKVLASLRADFEKLQVLRYNDGQRVAKVKLKFDRLFDLQLSFFHAEFTELRELKTFLEIFPGLVLPLELREESSIVHQALKNQRLAISRMLITLSRLAGSEDPRLYARALILSQCNDQEDLEAGWKLLRLRLKGIFLPVVPLLENRLALETGPDWINAFLSKRAKAYESRLAGQFEVMLGYSDSAKEMGSWPSRWLVSQSCHKLESVIVSHGLRPIFFHGSGGSVSRGGGPIEAQMSWWPSTARSYFKATLQGEMIQRTFASPEIFRSQMSKIVKGSQSQQIKSLPQARKAFVLLANTTQQAYQQLTEDPEFLNLVGLTTPYNYLHHLRLGSRPNKRRGPVHLGSLRAIPWVLCWTQLRLLLPAWWGFGSAFEQLTKNQQKQLQTSLSSEPCFQSYVGLLGFTLSKLRAQPFELALYRSPLTAEQRAYWKERVSVELKLTRKAYHFLTHKHPELQPRPWLKNSIEWRSKLVHPLNLLQLVALENQDGELLRETVTGIACGMLTTG